MNGVNIFRLLLQVPLVVSEFDALFKFRCLAQPLLWLSIGRPINFNLILRDVEMKDSGDGTNNESNETNESDEKNKMKSLLI